jgi:hypothetical protein
VSSDYKTLLGLVREFVEGEEEESRLLGLCVYCQGEKTHTSECLLGRARAAIAPSAPKPINDPKILHIGFGESACCVLHASRDARAGKLDNRMTWDCPQCGLEWRMIRMDGFAYIWTAQPAITVGRI